MTSTVGSIRGFRPDTINCGKGGRRKGSGVFTTSVCVTASPSVWTPISVDILERIVEESHDGGKTWLPHVKEH